uniref:Uncharacterized protein n=1 Tax=Strigamia maritima TaxID=126957 RepID=T1IK87_STRMM
MWKFMRGKGHQPSAERAKLQKELFQFNKTIHHGFPSKPTALAWDPKLHLMAIGARNGVIKVYGAPGIEFYGEHENADCSVLQIFFLPNQGRLITLCDDNTLHLWEINLKNEKLVMDKIKSYSLEGRLKIISTCCLQSNGEHLLIGTEGGNIYLLDVKSFEMTDHIIYQDVVMQNVPDDYKVNPGAVEAIAEHPTDPNKILIGYNRGLLVLWDNGSLNADQTYVGSQQLQSVSWHRKGTEFMSAHNDGSYIIWSVKDSTKPHQPATTPYGPFPCKAIKKVDWKSAKRGEFIIFNGGMPRASFGDRNTVTVISGEKHVVFELTSRVIDYFTISDSEESDEYDNPHTLIILAEEEMIGIDLESEDWPTFKAPYLSSLHSSAITCAQHCINIPEEFIQKIILCTEQNKETYSPREWPVNGGVSLNEMPTPCRDILLTGHEDGTVRFWNASGVALYPLYKLSTSQILSGEDAVEQNAIEEEEWPPFRKVGTFDPYSDDPRLAIKKITLCPYSGSMVIAGTAGQVLVLHLNTNEVEREIEVKTVNIVGDRDNFVWKGHDQLTVKTGSLKFAPGFQTQILFQLLPPAACTALALHTEWGLVAAGTAHGFTLLDYIQKKPVIFKCTLNPNDLSGYGETTMSRRKSFKKSLRESFRRLRKGRSQRQPKEKRASPAPPSPKTVIEEKKESKDAAAIDPDAPTLTDSSAPASPPDAKPVERSIEARSVDDTLGSMVRCLYLAQSFLVSVATTTPTLWAGTNNGAIFVFTISLPPKEKRDEALVQCQLGKEIQLKHRAPVIAICIVDASNCPIPEPFEVQHKLAKDADNVGNHRVVICSEEQFKVFTLPSLKPYCKFKLTAHEGSRVRKIAFSNFLHRNDASYSENCFMCLTNQGDLSVYSIPDLRRQLISACVKREDITGISSLVFTRKGEGFYLHSSSELQRFSLSAATITEARCMLELPEGMRPTVNQSTPLPATELNLVDDHPDIPPADGVTDDAKEEVQQQIEADKKDESTGGDTTIDSIRDHLINSNEETRITVTEEKTEVKQFTETIIQTTTLIPVIENVAVPTEEGSIAWGQKEMRYNKFNFLTKLRDKY